MATHPRRYQSIPARHLVVGDVVWHKGIVTRIETEAHFQEVNVSYAMFDDETYAFGEDVPVFTPRPLSAGSAVPGFHRDRIGRIHLTAEHTDPEFPIGNSPRHELAEGITAALYCVPGHHTGPDITAALGRSFTEDLPIGWYVVRVRVKGRTFYRDSQTGRRVVTCAQHMPTVWSGE